MKNLHKSLNKKSENLSSDRSETSDFDSDDRRIQKIQKTPEKIKTLENSEEESKLPRKESYVIKKLIRSRTFRKSGSEDTSNLENESSISQNSKPELQSPRNSEEISSEIETSQKSSQSKIQVIHSKYSGQETTLSTNEDSDLSLHRSTQIELANPSSVRKSRSKSRESEDIEEKGKRKGDKRRKKDFHRSRTSSSTRAQETLDEDAAKKKKRKKKKKKGEKEENREIKFISITVHKCDVLEIDYITRHPMVKVHIVNANTGDYLRNLESGEKTGKSHLQPVITGKFDFREHRSMIPMWEEELIFEHDFKDLLKSGDEQVLILFEVLDLLSFSEASLNYDQYGEFVNLSFRNLSENVIRITIHNHF